MAKLENLEYFTKGFFSLPLTILKIPTSIRRVTNGETWLDKKQEERREEYSSFQNIISTYVGVISGSMATLFGISYLGEEASKGNWLPVGILATTNAISFAYEKSKKNYSAMRREPLEYETSEKGFIIGNIYEGIPEFCDIKLHQLSKSEFMRRIEEDWDRLETRVTD